MRKRLILAVAAFGLASTTSAAAAPRCALGTADLKWIASALAASDSVRVRHLHLPPISHPAIVLFDRQCRFEATASARPRWTGTRHGQTIVVPDGSEIPVAVTSFSGQTARGEPFFVMALPSLWRAAKVPISAKPNGLTGVFLHEYQHVAQAPLVQPLFDRARRYLPAGAAEPDDDAIQTHFQADPDYVAAYQRERALLFGAAAAPDLATTRRRAAQALASMRARHARWFTGANAYWKRYDDLFLTLEGVGQWTAVAWLADPRGGGMRRPAAQDLMRGSRKWWSQEEGLALFLTLDRLMPGWPARAFARNPELAIDLLAEAVRPPRGKG